ncbi:marvel domain-containing protein [Phyllosticta citrichinensis]|uniref:Marvel domain-containing protein n=1 Tax=Phyllosticta citrichinensis TaxID=1130410 RepID=A0ABR1Y561_9PEZI
MASKALNVILRGLQFFWTLLIMALVGSIIADAFSGNPSVINYTMFAAVFAMLSLFYLIPATVKDGLGVPLVMMGLDVVNTLFFLCGGIALAAYLGVHSCSNDAYTKSNSITNGAADTAKRCREAQASTAFLWFGFAAFAASAVFSFLQRRDGLAGSSGASSVRGPAPSMSQV